MKRAFKIKYKAFFIIFKGLSLKQIKQFFSGSWDLGFNKNNFKKKSVTVLNIISIIQ